MSSTLCDTCDKDSRYMAAMAENAKLRELVRDMWTWRDALPYWMRAEICDRMRELGVVS